ncbi:hypothetical protein RvY_05057 [Ramazzottius varieornatus]|uniref:Uncharacterized protein n=1 Tax=Ramazzottius varieornatus TaxID=947166 RepID=A0A1D1V3N8_RAMVA|nr:hypothetical protein RvY_05057 [Ramazzottius varieornatus]
MPNGSPGSFRRSVTGIRKSQRVSKHPAAFESEDSNCDAKLSQDDTVDPCSVLPVLNLSRNDYEHPVIFGEWMALMKKAGPVIDRPSRSSSRKSSAVSFSPSPTDSLLHHDEERFQQEVVIAAEANPEIRVPRSIRHVAKKAKAVDYSLTAEDDPMEEFLTAVEDPRDDCVSPDGASLISEDFSQSPRSAYHTPVNSQPMSLKTVENSPNEFFTQPSSFPAEVRRATLCVSARESTHLDGDRVEREVLLEKRITKEFVVTVFRESFIDDALDIVNQVSQPDGQPSQQTSQHSPISGRSAGNEISAIPSTNDKSRFTTYEIPDNWPFAAVLTKSNPADGEAAYRFSERPKILPVKVTEQPGVPDPYQLPLRRMWRPMRKNREPEETPQETPLSAAGESTAVERVPVDSATLAAHPRKKEPKQKKKKKFKRGHKWKTFRRIKNRLKVGNDESFSFWQMSSWNSHSSQPEVSESVRNVSSSAASLISELEPSQTREAETIEERGSEKDGAERPTLSEGTNAQPEATEFQTAQSQLQPDEVPPECSDEELNVVKSSADSEVGLESDSDTLIAEWAEMSDAVDLANVATLFHTLLQEPFD